MLELYKLSNLENNLAREVLMSIFQINKLMLWVTKYIAKVCISKVWSVTDSGSGAEIENHLRNSTAHALYTACTIPPHIV